MLSFQFLQLLLLGAEFLLAVILIMIWSSLKSEREQYQKASKQAYKKLERFAADLEEHTTEILHDLKNWQQQTMESELKTMQNRIAQEGTQAAAEIHQTSSDLSSQLQKELSTLPTAIANQIQTDFAAQLESVRADYAQQLEKQVNSLVTKAAKQLLVSQIDQQKQHQIVQNLLTTAWEQGDLETKQK